MYYEMTTGQHLFHFVKAIKWSNLRWKLVERTFSFSPPNLFISQTDVSAEACRVVGQYVQPQFHTVLKCDEYANQLYVCGVSPVEKVSMGSSLITP